MYRRKAPRLAESGFTLIEVMIVVVIIGILAALAIPRFNMAAHQSKEKEADVQLKQVFTLQQTYYANNGEWAATETHLRTVGFDPPVGFKYYQWNGNVSLPLCLPSTGTWAGRRIDTNGNITDC
ncbi:MAG TPA: prepilin-type N-terminal cleavage/methylation domain-containing protein [Longimicrobium sp.]|nr:prepilin-type N-terminal cleavage/methylation domain-containing protein [Longimicrobium sp.]